MKRSLRFRPIVLALLIGCSASPAGAVDPPQVGDRAPPIDLETLLFAPADAKTHWEALQGQVVVLEFWATWCAPCIPAMDHLDSLAVRLEDEPVRFIAITAEALPPVRRFFKHRTTRMWIGLDTDRSMFEAYQPAVYPHTVVVDPTGRIAAITHPENVTERTLRRLLAGQSINPPFKPYAVPEVQKWAQRQERLDATALFKATMRPSHALSAGITTYTKKNKYYNRRIIFHNVLPIVLLEQAYDRNVSRFIDKAGLSGGDYKGYDVDVIVPEGQEEVLLPTLKRVVLTSLNLTIEPVMQDMDVWVLMPIDSIGIKLQPSRADSSYYWMRGPYLEAINQPVDKLVQYVQKYLDKPLVNDIDLEGRYDFSLTWTYGDPEYTLYDALRTLGLKVEKDTRRIEMLVIRSADVEN